MGVRLMPLPTGVVGWDHASGLDVPDAGVDEDGVALGRLRIDLERVRARVFGVVVWIVDDVAVRLGGGVGIRVPPLAHADHHRGDETTRAPPAPPPEEGR